VTEKPRTIRVLLVDDHAMVVEAFRRLLAACSDIEVVATAGTAADAVVATVTHTPDVVVVDYLLPDDVGAVAAARIATTMPGVKVIMLTGSDDPRALRAALAAGCVGYLEKTGPHHRLPDAIRIVASGGTVISADDLRRLHAAGVDAQSDGSTLLTLREREVLLMMAEGWANRVIADKLFLTVNTVRSHVQTILEKLDAHSKLEAVTVARRRGLIDGAG
jgi:DNA-binding NarL/FixJ family response regulator